MYTVINQQGNLSLGKACPVLDLSRCGYYRWLKQEPVHLAHMDIRSEMQNIAMTFPSYGYRRMTKELQRRFFDVNHKLVLRLMGEDNLLCVRKKLFKPITTQSNHNFPVYPNLAKDLEVTDLNQLWVADITYIRLLNEFIYLAVIIDVFSRKCIGWALDRNIDAQLTLNALSMALANRRGVDISGLVHHSDQGVQYASYGYVDLLKERGIMISMSRKGNPYDNAFAESFMKTLKYEEVYMKEYEGFNDAHANIEKFIEDAYNQKRLHSGIGYRTPDDVEKGGIL